MVLEETLVLWFHLVLFVELLSFVFKNLGLGDEADFFVNVNQHALVDIILVFRLEL